MTALRPTSVLAALLLLSPGCTTSCPPAQSKSPAMPVAQATAPARSPAQVALRAFLDVHFEEHFHCSPMAAKSAEMLMELREDAKAKWGKDFTLQRVHDQMVSYGYPPVPIVRRLMLGEDTVSSASR